MPLGDKAKGIVTPAVATVAPRQNPPRYGIREDLTLTHSIQLNAGALGSLHWHVASEQATNDALFYQNGVGVLTQTNPHTATYSCPGFPARVTLELQQQNGTVLDRVSFDVIAPDEATTHLIQFGPTHHVQGFCCTAFEAVVVLGPADVAFTHVEMQEFRGAQTNSGPWKDIIAGAGNYHSMTSAPDPHHAGQFLPVWIGYRDMTQHGTRLNGYDTVGNWGVFPAGTRAWAPNGSKDMWARSDWPIQWRYRVAGMVPASGITFMHALHQCTVYSTGEMELKKAGTEVRTRLNDATSHSHAWSGYTHPPQITVPWPATPAPPPPP